MRDRLPRQVVMLGIVSLCMDTSSELIHSLLPVLLVGALGASPALLGLIEGIAEATASVLRIVSGTLSDRLRARKPLLLAGYGLAALSKPLFPLAAGPLTVLLARVADRIGKGIRGAPRDALVADVTPPQQRGAAYGLRQGLDTLGAVLGPLLALVGMWLLTGDVRTVLWIAVLPAVAAVVVLVRVDEPPRGVASTGTRSPRGWLDGVTALPRACWIAIAVVTVLTLARFSEAFLLLRGSELGLGERLAPLVFVVMNLAYAVSAYPAGRLSDRIGRVRLLGPALLLLIAADIALACADGVALALLGAMLWGLHLGVGQGAISALIADRAPAPLRGTAFGVVHAAGGVATLIASVLAGWLWQRYGAASSFVAGAVFAGVTMLLLPVARRSG